MLRMIGESLTALMLRLLVGISVAFWAFQLIPGDALTATMRSVGASNAQIETRREVLGLDETLPIQYVHYLRRAAMGDLGVSIANGLPVNQLIRSRLAPTLQLGLSALVFSAVVGPLLALLMNGSQRWLSVPATMLTTLGVAVPVYWSGTLLIYVFAVWLAMLPAGGGSRLSHLIMPTLALGGSLAAQAATLLNAEVRQVRRQPFMTVARSKGLSTWRVNAHHTLRNVAPVYFSLISVQLGFVLGGVVIVESLFARPGLGRLTVESILKQDYTVVQGLVVWSVVIHTVLGAVGRMLAVLTDPRLRVV